MLWKKGNNVFSGNFIWPPTMRYFIDTYSWKGASLLLGGIVLNCVVCGSLLRPPPKKIVPKVQISIVTFPL